MGALKLLWSAVRLIVNRLMFQTPNYRLTLEGFLFLVVTIFIGFAAFNTDINLLYLILSIMCAFLVVSGMLSTISLRPVKVERQLPKRFTAGEAGQVTLIVRNKKRLFNSYSLRIIDHLRDNREAGRAFLLSLPCRSQVRLTYPCLFRRRGVYHFKEIKVSSRFPFGFFERSTYIKAPDHILVYPQTINLSRNIRVAADPHGERESAQKGQGSSLYGLREYTTSDSARNIHWKVSARIDNLIVREFESDQRRRYRLILNNHVAEPITDELSERFEKAVILCASLAKLLLGMGYQVQLTTSSGRVPSDTGSAHLGRILRALAIVELESTGGQARLGGIGNQPAEAHEATNYHVEFQRLAGREGSQSHLVLSVDDVEWRDLDHAVA